VAQCADWGEAAMRLAIIAAVLMIAGAASAADEGWREFTYPESGFAAQYPARPRMEMRDYRTAQVPEGVVRELTYSVSSGGVIYEVDVADFTKTAAGKDRTIEEAASHQLAQGKMTHDESGARVDFNYGREIRIEDGMGGSITNAIFFIDKKLYQLKVTFPADNTDPAGSSGIHFFQQTFRLLNGY
jgi:hypothetical protein